MKINEHEEIFKPSDIYHPFFQYFNDNFDKRRYAYSGVLPLQIGKFQIEFKEVTNVLRCPIKTKKDRNIYLPSELEFLKSFVDFCCIYETSFNPKFDDLYMHITVDLKKIKAGETYRTGGFHVDGFQGHKFQT